MKKKLLAGIVVLSAASMLCGFDSAETVESVTDKMQEASQSAESMSMDMSMNLDASINVGDGETTSNLAVAMKGDFAIDYTMDPMAMKMDGNMTVSALGQGEDVKMQMYGVTNENGEFETYVYSEDSTSGESGWTYDVEEGLDMAALMETSKNMDFGTLSDWGIQFTLAPEAADVNGTECYLLSTVFDTTTIDTMLNKVTEMTGQDIAGETDISEALALLNGLQMSIEYYVDAATYLPVQMHIDFNDSDLTTLNQLLEASMGASADSNTTMELILNNFSIDATVSYDNVEPITVPEEALAAVASGEAQSVSDLAEVLESEAN